MEKEFSVVIPIYNEKESLGELFEKLQSSIEKFKKPYEIIFIDDGSTDGSFDFLKSLEKNGKNPIKVYSFRKNLGKSYALMYGFKKANGKYIATLDADLQDDPQNVKLLFEKLKRANFDLVTGWRKNRKDNFMKKLVSGFSNKIVSYIFKVKIHDLNSGLKIYTKETAKDLRLYGGMHRFIPLLANDMGYKVGEKETIHYPRKYGQSKYKPTKIITDLPDLITLYFLTKYNRRPLHFFGKIGSILFLAGFLILFYLTVLHFGGEAIGRRPLLIFGILFVIAGLQIIFTGLLADLFVNTTQKDDDNLPIRYESVH